MEDSVPTVKCLQFNFGKTATIRAAQQADCRLSQAHPNLQCPLLDGGCHWFQREGRRRASEFFAAPGAHREHGKGGIGDPHVALELGHVFSAAASSEKDKGSMNLASNTAPVPSTMPSTVAANQRITGWRTQRWTSLMACPVLRSYQLRLSDSVASPSWTMRLPVRSSRSASPRFSRQSRSRAASSVPMMIRASEPPMNERSMTAANDLAVRRALEAAGVEFIDENGGGPGVRLRKPHRLGPRK